MLALNLLVALRPGVAPTSSGQRRWSFSCQSVPQRDALVQIGGSEELPLGPLASEELPAGGVLPTITAQGGAASVKSRRSDWLAGLVADPPKTVPGSRASLGWASGAVTAKRAEKARARRGFLCRKAVDAVMAGV